MARKPQIDNTDEIRTILDAAPFPLLISRVSDGTVLYTNDSLAAYAGLTAAEMMGQKTPDYYADPSERQALLDEVRRSGRVSNWELRLRHKNGEARVALASVVATKFRGDDVLVAGLNDITARKEAEESLRHSEERFRGLVENANDIIYLLKPDGFFTYISPNWTDVLGHEVGEIVGTNFAPLIHEDDLERCYAFLNAVLETGEKHSGIEYRVKHKDGSWRWHTSNASALKDEEGNVTGFVGIARDITEKKKAQLDLEQALRELREREVQLIQSERMAALGRLVRGVAHEINSPIGAIHSMHETMSSAVARLLKHLTEVPPDPKQNPEFDVIIKTIIEADHVIGQGTKRVTEIVNSLRSFTRLDEAELKQCDIHEGIDTTLTLIDHELRGRVEVKKDYGEFEPIVCYPGRLNQVFLNILTNAANAIEGKGRITIQTSATKDEIHIVIRDNGRGIPSELLDQIFEPSFTAKGGRIGAGLGMPISYYIMHQHQGRIDVESKVAKGTKVTLTLPRNLRAEPPPRSA